MVDFLEGDPDQPLVTGRIYNAEQMPPYPLPDNMTQSLLKTRSSKGGTGPTAFNQIRFEDLSGSEDLLIHAEKDMHTEVEHDDTQFVPERSKDHGGWETEPRDNHSRHHHHHHPRKPLSDTQSGE